MTIAVIDTSALLRLFVPDGPIPRDLERLVADAARSEAILLIPGLALSEAAQALRKKEIAGFLTSREVDDILGAVLGLPLDVVPDRDLVSGAMIVSRESGLTVYDSMFVALAIRKRADLVTADRALETAWRKVNRQGDRQ